MKRTVSMWWKIYVVLVLAAAWRIQAEPYIAVRTGFKCSQCHVNGTGGGKRTEFGQAYTQYKLLVASALAEKNLNSFDPKLNGSVSLGANFRIEQAYLRQFTTKAANPGDSLRTVEPDWNAGSFKEKNLYLEMNLIKDRLKLYYDLDMSNGGFRELWSMISLPGNTFVKFGRMLMPYGYRLMDDEAFVRNITGYDYNFSSLAYELGFEPGPLSLVTNITQSKWVSVGSLVFTGIPVLRTVRLGGSYSRELTKEYKDKKGTYGVFAGTTLGMFTFLGERDYTKDAGIDKIEDYLELDFLPWQGMNFKVTYESYWPTTLIPQAQNNQTRTVVGVEPFIMQFLQLGLYYRKNDWIPQSTANNQDQIVGRLHVFF